MLCQHLGKNWENLTMWSILENVSSRPQWSRQGLLLIWHIQLKIKLLIEEVQVELTSRELSITASVARNSWSPFTISGQRNTLENHLQFLKFIAGISTSIEIVHENSKKPGCFIFNRLGNKPVGLEVCESFSVFIDQCQQTNQEIDTWCREWADLRQIKHVKPVFCR